MISFQLTRLVFPDYCPSCFVSTPKWPTLFPLCSCPIVVYSFREQIQYLRRAFNVLFAATISVKRGFVFILMSRILSDTGRPPLTSESFFTKEYMVCLCVSLHIFEKSYSFSIIIRLLMTHPCFIYSWILIP